MNNYGSVEKVENLFKITGIAESNNRISKLMRNIDESEWFTNPNLSSVRATDKSIGEQDAANEFNLTFTGVKLETKEGGR